MRIDKYLKVTRIIKRRVIAKELSVNNRLLVNNKKVKASYEIKLDDHITILFGNHTLNIKVLQIKEYTTKENAYQLFEIIEDNNN